MVYSTRFSFSPRMLLSVTLLVLAVSNLVSAISPCPNQNSSNSLNVTLTRISPPRNDSYLLIFGNTEEAMPIYQDTELESTIILINFVDCPLEAGCLNGSWVDVTLEITQCDAVLPTLPIDAVVSHCRTTKILTVAVEGSCNRTEDSQPTPPLLTSETIRQCNFTVKSDCADYCNTPDAFRISNDTDDTADTPFAMLSDEEKLSDFCTCLEMTDVNCSESRETCEEFCNSIRSPRRPLCDNFQANFKNDFCSRTLCQEDIEPCNSVSLTNPDTEACSEVCRDNLRSGVGSPCDFLIQNSCENAIITLFTIRESICDGSLSSEVTFQQISIFLNALKDFINFQDFIVKIDILQLYLQSSVIFLGITTSCEPRLLEEFDALLRELYVDVLDNVFGEGLEIFPSVISDKYDRTPQEQINSIIDLSLKRFAEVAIRPTSPINSVELAREHLYFHISRLNASNVDKERNKFTLRINEGVFKGTELIIPLDGINYLMNETVASVMVTQNLAGYLDQVNRFTNNDLEGNEMSNGVLVSVRLLQRQSSTADLTDIKDFSDAPVKLVVPQTSSFTNSTCVFWDTLRRLWSEEGVETVSDPSDLLVQCEISHFTSFAILGSLRAEVLTELPQAEQQALSIITYLGCAVSIVALVLTILALVLFRHTLDIGPLLYLHLNLAIALLMVYILFVSTVEPAHHIYGLCIVSAALLHYFLLCSMCWMLSEGVMLYLKIVKVFGAAEKKLYWFMLLGWGVPLPVVILSASIIEGTSGSSATSYIYKDNYCWLNPDFTKPAVWTFIVPMVIIVMINSIFLVLTLYHILRWRKNSSGAKNMELVKHGVKAAVILFPLLGLTWILSIFVIHEGTSIFAWLFTIFNSLQGLLIFTLHVVKNNAFQAKLRERWCQKSMKVRETRTHFLRQNEAAAVSETTGTLSSHLGPAVESHYIVTNTLPFSVSDIKSSNDLNEKNEGITATMLVNGFSESCHNDELDHTPSSP